MSASSEIAEARRELVITYRQVGLDAFLRHQPRNRGALIAELIDLGAKAGIVEKSGSWYSYDGSRIGQGREQAKTFLAANPDVANSIEQAIRANAGQIGQNLVLNASEEAGAEVPGTAATGQDSAAR